MGYGPATSRPALLPALVGGAWAAAVGDGFWHGAATAFLDRLQFDSSAELIRGFEGLGWAHDVRWPGRNRIEARRV